MEFRFSFSDKNVPNCVCSDQTSPQRKQHQPIRQTLSYKPHSAHNFYCKQEWKDEQSSKAALHHILIRLFIQSGHEFSVVPESYTNKSLRHVRFVLTRKQQRKKKPVCDHENKRTFSDFSPLQRGHCDFVVANLTWISSKFTNVPLESVFFSYFDLIVPVGRKVGDQGRLWRYKNKSKQHFEEETSSLVIEKEDPELRWAESVAFTVNACMHVDTGTELDSSRFVGPQLRDKSILGTVGLNKAANWFAGDQTKRPCWMNAH